MNNKSTFKLIKNDYINSGLCVYEDDFGNRLQMFRKKSNDGNEWLNSFTAKLRFKDKNVRANSLNINLPVNESDKGVNLHLDFLDKQDKSHTPDVQSAISMITEIIQRWIAMSNDIALFNTPNAVIKTYNPALSESDINKKKIALLTDYPELQDLLSYIMRVGGSGSCISHT